MCQEVLGAYNMVYILILKLLLIIFIFVMLGVINYGNRTIAAIETIEIPWIKHFGNLFFQLLVGLFVTALYFICCISYVKKVDLCYYAILFLCASGIFDVNWLCFGLKRFKLTTIRSVIVRLGMVFAIFYL